VTGMVGMEGVAMMVPEERKIAVSEERGALIAVSAASWDSGVTAAAPPAQRAQKTYSGASNRKRRGDSSSLRWAWRVSPAGGKGWRDARRAGVLSVAKSGAGMASAAPQHSGASRLRGSLMLAINRPKRRRLARQISV